jgi:DNA-binding XRE family transcriptional regulator
MSEAAKALETRRRRRTHEEMLAESMKDPAFRKAYKEAEQDFAFFDECVEARKRAGMTQGDVAKRMGTSIAAVSRIETAGDRNFRPSPSVSTIQRYAAALGCRLVLKLEPIAPAQPGSHDIGFEEAGEEK